MVGARKIPDISDRKPPGRFLWSLPRRFDLWEIYGVFTRKSPENVGFQDFLMEISGGDRCCLFV
jgi:hypothetical protein